MFRSKKYSIAVAVGCFILSATPLKAALLAHYSFDDSSIVGGQLQNVHNPGDGDGVIFGLGAGLTTGVAGISGEAFEFNSLGSVNLGPSSVRNQMEVANTWSISAWVRMSGVAPGNILYRREVGGITDGEGGLRVEVGGTPQVFMQDHTSASTSLDSPVSINVGEWAHIVGIREVTPGSDWRLYVDGAEFSGPGTSLLIPANAGLPELGVDLVGALDEVRVYDHALTQEEVLTLFAEGNATEVPAPGALAIFGVGVLGMGLVRRRRR